MGRKRNRPTIENVSIFGIADKGKSIARTEEGEVLFIEGGVPGDVVDVQIVKKRKGLRFGKVTRLISPSEHRIKPQCDHFGVCGGCKWQNLDYTEQINQKEQVVSDAITRIAGIKDATALPIVGSKKIYQYRNKLEYTFSSKRWLTEEEIASDEDFDSRHAAGFHRPGAFDKIVDIGTCHLQKEPSNDIRNWIKAYAIENDLSFYNIREHKGFLRNLIIRITEKGEKMALLSVGEDNDGLIPLMEALDKAFPDLDSLQYVINSKKNDTIYDLEVITFKGKDTIIEQLNHVQFEISAKSFFQTNSIQGITLYDITKDFCKLEGHENVYDLYSGLGSITCYVADSAKKVVAIEEIEQAVLDAEKNAQLNGLTNLQFYCGDVKNILTSEFKEKHGSPDVVITDPPRAGMHADVVAMLLELAAPRIVYVSCNPATQARDLKLLSEKYNLVQYQPVDMFPHTHHIENVALLELKD